LVGEERGWVRVCGALRFYTKTAHDAAATAFDSFLTNIVHNPTIDVLISICLKFMIDSWSFILSCNVIHHSRGTG
jgi:hypothetical protein